MTIDIIWSLAAKGMLIKKIYLYFGKKKQYKEVNHWVLQPDPHPLSEKNYFFFLYLSLRQR